MERLNELTDDELDIVLSFIISLLQEDCVSDS